MTTRSRQLLLVVVAAVIVFAGISVYADASSLAQRLATYSWWTFGAALALALLNYALRFLRWHRYLVHQELEINRVLSLQIFVSGFALSITPGKLGELVKSYLLRETRGIPLAQSIPIVFAERVTDLIALLLLGIIGVAWYGVASGMVVAGIVVVGGGMVVLSWPKLAHAAIRAMTGPQRLRRFREQLQDFYQGIAHLLRPSPLSWATGIGATAWMAECVGFALIVSGFGDAHVPLGLAMLIYAATTVAGALSFLPGGLLVTEAAMATLLVTSSTGLDQAGAGAATILTRLATLWFAVLLGVVALAWLRRRQPGVASAFRTDTEMSTAEDRD